MLLLYVTSTGDGWDDVMFAGMAATSPGKAPERNDFSPAAFFFIAWMFVGSFVALNLFVGTIVDNFTRIKSETDGSATMTEGQQQWVTAMRTRQKTAPTKVRMRILVSYQTQQSESRPCSLCKAEERTHPGEDAQYVNMTHLSQPTYKRRSQFPAHINA